MAQDMFRNQVYQSKDFAGMVTDNNIFSIYQQKPQVLDNAFRRIYSMYPAAAAVNYVNSFPVMEVEQENEQQKASQNNWLNWALSLAE